LIFTFCEFYFYGPVFVDTGVFTVSFKAPFNLLLGMLAGYNSD